VEGQTPMKHISLFTGSLLTMLALSVPAFATEDGLIETTSSTPNEDATSAGFERVITNLSEGPIDVAPRDLRMVEYPVMTLVEITVGTFDGGIWTVGTLEAGQTATIIYTGDAAPAPEELPFTGERDHLASLAVVGLALIGLGVSLLHTARD
jgi:hypothetical protein